MLYLFDDGLNHWYAHRVAALPVFLPEALVFYEIVGEPHKPIALVDCQFADSPIVQNPEPPRGLLRRQGGVNPVN